MEASEILAQGYPNEEQLLRFPLGKLLVSIPDVDPRYGRQTSGPGHIDRVLEGVNLLMSPHPERIVKAYADEKPFIRGMEFERAYKLIFSDARTQNGHGFCRFDSVEERDGFFRLLALYHDIGKAVITERHPLVGWHLIKDVHAAEVETWLWPLLLGRDYSKWKRELELARGNVDCITTPHEQRLLKLFNNVVRFHDYFGILSTGEGSPLVMVDLIDLRGVDPADARELFSILMIFSLADVYGSVPEVLAQKVDVFCEDWELLCKAISNPTVNGDRAQFFEHLRSQTQNPRSTVERLWRLMYEGTPADWRDEIRIEMVEQIFKEATLSRMYPFINNFALFCKLDYCLAFKIMLMSVAKRMDATPSLPVSVMSTVLAELEKRYGDLCQRPDRTWRRIGFEMAGLTRRPGTHKDVKQRTKSMIGETITELLLRSGGLGKEWAVSECTVWFMEE
ncbi:MAG: hypothetical protein LC130_03940 [Bryobacterales bacterium]|nr:hypothetical protein [Bryobacterales bacterium]